jgi:hypothetical protein
MSLIRGAGSMPTIDITYQDLSISQLRVEAARTADAKQTANSGHCHGANPYSRDDAFICSAFAAIQL